MEGIPGELENYFKKKFSKNAFKEENLIILDDLMEEAQKSIKITLNCLHVVVMTIFP